MNEKKREQIRTLRFSGYSYRQIADLLKMKRSTVSSYCLRHHVEFVPKTGPEGYPQIRYGLCPMCRKLFIITGKNNKEFCSDKCRTDYWKRKYENESAMAAEAERHRTLQKELDFLRKKSDELVGDLKIGCSYDHINEKEE